MHCFSYARYCKAIEEITGFPMEDCLSLPGLGWKYFKSLRTDKNSILVISNKEVLLQKLNITVLQTQSFNIFLLKREKTKLKLIVWGKFII